MAQSEQPDFWSPRFRIEKRDDGTVFMEQTEPLAQALPTIADYLDHWADADPERLWLARRDRSGAWVHLTYGEARLRARALGAVLLSLKLGPGRPLLILSENSIEHAICALACAYVGVPFAPVSPAYSLLSKDHRKLRDIAALLNPGAVFADNGKVFKSAIESIATEPAMPMINHVDPLPGALNLSSLFEHDPSAAMTARAALGAHTVLKYLFTSGSTGSPKAVINTNGMVTANQAMIRDCYRFLATEPPIVLDWAPWNHTAAGNKVTYMVLTNGGTYYIDDGKPTADGFQATIQNLREVASTWYFNVPAGYDRLVEALEADPALAQTFFSRLRMMFYAGAGLSQQTWDRLTAVARETTGQDVLISSSLGATETAPFALSWTELERSAGKIGVPARGLRLKLVAQDDRYEVRLKGPSITPGYFRDPESTANAFDDEGYYCIGDAVRPEDPDDFTRGFYFDGRIAENFKLSTGTWVSVGAVRSALVDAMQGLVRDAVIVGENESKLGALLWLSEAGSALSEHELQRRVADCLAAHGQAATGSSNRVRRVSILLHPPGFDAGELTEKGSINQRALRKNRARQIRALYANEGLVIGDEHTPAPTT